MQGVVLDGGATVTARCVVANVNPKLLYLKLIDATELPQEFLSAHAKLPLRLGHNAYQCRAQRVA